MGLSSAMDWWDEWKLRILVLCSLFVQFFLFYSELIRRWYIRRRLRILVWIAYIGGDALAVYALATLFNRQKQQTTVDGGGNALEVLWAPVLLIHLGGQPSISAYSLEDNELWKRHTITLVSQVMVALYVFCKWWSGEKKLLQAAILLFIVGILRLTQKPWALRRASLRTLAASTKLSPRSERSSSAWSALSNCLLKPVILQEAHEENIGGDVSSLEEYVKTARELVEGAKASDEAQQEVEFKKSKNHAIKYIYTMFLDLSSPYSFRLPYLQYFLKFDDMFKHRVLSQWIQRQFSIMYTKQKSFDNYLGGCLFWLLLGLALAPVVLFAKSSKDGYNKSDVTVTYILFSGTAMIEFAPFCFTLLAGFLTGFLIAILHLFQCISITNAGQLQITGMWQDIVSQHNIMLFCVRNKKPSTLMKLAVFSRFIRNYITKQWYICHVPAAQQISALVGRHAQDGWKEYIRDEATYRRFSNLRGEQTLRKHHHLLQQLGWIFSLPFDEYVLVWHVATDLCGFHHTNTSSQGDAIPTSRHNSEIISNHMIYLLFICPEMLMLGTRQDLFLIACDDIEEIIKDDKPPSSLLDERSIAQWIISRIMEQANDLLMQAPMIYKAHKLAKALIDLDDNDKMWEVIQGVWIEMLCYSASRSRGYEHAKSLAFGGEYITNVWLLWSLMGMETLADKMHQPGPPESDDHDEEQAPVAASV